MNGGFRDSSHLLRLVAVLVAAIGVFLVLRHAVVPEAFGQYGHFRPGAIDDNAKRNPVHAGQAECLMCHEDQAKARAAGKHKGVACEACHGPQAVHAADPGAVKPQKPDSAILCARCHEKDAAKPHWFPQVVTREHSQGMACNSCHQPHQPKISEVRPFIADPLADARGSVPSHDREGVVL